MSDYVQVSSFDGLYDEECVNRIYNVNYRKLCFRHKFVSGSLEWMQVLGTKGMPFGVEIRDSATKGYGEVRFCERCKIIYCMHRWKSETTYEIAYGPYYSVIRTVCHCGRCGLRVALGTSGHCKPSNTAIQLIDSVAAELGQDSPYSGSYGSGWVCELPIVVSGILDSRGKEVAKQYLRDCFASHSCEGAVHEVHALTSRLRQ